MSVIDYEAANKQYRQQKSALTRAKNGGDPVKVLAAVEKAVKEWNVTRVWPDTWHTWNIALGDAFYAYQRDHYDWDSEPRDARIVRRFEACTEAMG